jgi:Tfp pilus assembly protein PilN
MNQKMSQQEEIIIKLKGKVREIISVNEKVKSDNDLLTKENKGLIEIVKSKQREIVNFEKKFDTLKVAKTVVMSAEDKHEAKLKVNRIVREIDKCIALLNK